MLKQISHNTMIDDCYERRESYLELSFMNRKNVKGIFEGKNPLKNYLKQVNLRASNTTDVMTKKANYKRFDSQLNLVPNYK